MQSWQIIILAFSGLSVFNSLALIIYLLFTQKTETRDVFLQIILVAFIFQVVHALMDILQVEAFPYRDNLYLLGIYMQGPSMYLLIRKTLHFELKVWPGLIMLHYAPWLIISLLPYDFNSMGPKEWIATYLVGLQSLAYIFLCVRPYLTARRLYLQKEKKYYFVSWLFPAYAALWFTYPFSGITNINYQIIEIILHSVFLYYLIVIKLKAPVSDKNKYRFSRIDESSSMKIFEKVNNILEMESLFLNPNLTLNILARKAALPANILSQVINQNAGVNFRDYINRFRIDKAKSEILDKTDQGFTIASVAFDSGFNSLSAFNRAFYKVVNKTPSEYIKTNRS